MFNEIPPHQRRPAWFRPVWRQGVVAEPDSGAAAHVGDHAAPILRGEPFVSAHGHSWEASSFYLVLNVALVLLGPGSPSLDWLLFGRRLPFLADPTGGAKKALPSSIPCRGNTTMSENTGAIIHRPQRDPHPLGGDLPLVLSQMHHDRHL
ncbi:MAG: hypothetical protein DMG06_24145 [Acidobacteria bacterium]|nr:MAG: hypothetical protein DMG06_24145 [Acidobacteriota bacterium]